MELRKMVNKKNILAKLFLYSSIFFILCNFLGPYNRKIYSLLWFIMFYVFELLFFLGLKSQNLVLSSSMNKVDLQYNFRVTRNGRVILLIFNFLAILSFFYFVFLYKNIVGFSMLGTYTANEFQNARPNLEKLTLLIMQIGGEMTYLILYADKTFRKTKRFNLAKCCLFLPGLRSLMLGNRFTIALEFVLFFLTNWKDDQSHTSKILEEKKKIILIVAIGMGILACFMYLFASRSVYGALEKSEFFHGDMITKSAWKKMYELSGGRIDFLFTFFDYLTESPYVFSYFCQYQMPDNILFGQLTFRSIMQIISTLFGTNNSYIKTASSIASGKYSGFGYTLIADFGVYLAPFMAYIIGVIFSKIERYRNRNCICASLFPLVKAICIFAPVVYFDVGRCDYPFLFTIIFAPLCLHRIQIKENIISNKLV